MVGQSLVRPVLNMQSLLAEVEKGVPGPSRHRFTGFPALTLQILPQARSAARALLDRPEPL